ncbi:unnamed protein product [Trifolium pratense]|uniref:Uncharacterized protein n=2 Tax=Trifolium pratense TaxID=57577 RepID=A0ACB0K413_TRIPR|nr:unnamed protein product [Trifolium pratense]CAJ2651104.1 unnamed protein product [Trifolium pratense]
METLKAALGIVSSEANELNAEGNDEGPDNEGKDVSFADAKHILKPEHSFLDRDFSRKKQLEVIQKEETTKKKGVKDTKHHRRVGLSRKSTRMIHPIQIAVRMMRRQVEGSTVGLILTVVIDLILIVMLRGRSRPKRSKRHLSTTRKAGWRTVMILILVLILMTASVQEKVIKNQKRLVRGMIQMVILIIMKSYLGIRLKKWRDI